MSWGPTLGSTRVDQEIAGARGTGGDSPYCGFSGKEQARQGEQV